MAAPTRDTDPPSHRSAAKGATGRPRRVALTWGSWAKLVAVATVAWVCLQLSQLALVLLVAALLAITLDPVVSWLEGRGMKRTLAAVLIAATLVAVAVIFAELSWASLADQGQLIVQRGKEAYAHALARAPWLARLGADQGHGPALAAYGIRIVRSLGEALVVAVLGLILTVYLLVDGRRTWAWIRVFVPHRQRGRLDETARAVRREVFGYMAGNVATSLFAAVFVFVALSALRVPASLVLALLAGLLDFVPVLGFVLSATPAVLLALTVSGTTALIVAALYVAYHLLENYLIAPKVYGDRLCLSDLAVLVAFAVGAQLAGVIGALVALPIAAAYPAVERIWLTPYLGEDVAEEHDRVSQSPEH